jgi:hypothetical protein
MIKRFAMLVLATAILGAASGRAEATTIGSGPIRIVDNNNYACSVVNYGTKPIAVEVNVTIAGGGYGAETSCPTLGPNEVCTATNDAGSASYRFCTVTTSNKRSTRGSFCNNTTGICVPVQ